MEQRVGELLDVLRSLGAPGDWYLLIVVGMDVERELFNWAGGGNLSPVLLVPLLQDALANAQRIQESGACSEGEKVHG